MCANEKPITVIASLYPRHLGKPAPRWFVASVPGEGQPTSDWGYTSDRSQALPLSQYWADRFATDCEETGERFGFSAKSITTETR